MATPAPRAAGTPITFNLNSVQPLQWGIVAGFLLAVLATFLAWVKISGFGESESASAWNGDLGGDLRIGNWLGTVDGVPVEALIIVAIAAAGIYLVLGPAAGQRVPNIPYAAIGLGAALVVLGVLNYLYIEDKLSDADEAGISAGASIGVYLLIIGGLITAGSGYLVEQQKKKVPGQAATA